MKLAAKLQSRKDKMMDQITELAPVHCYTNPSFCRQSEYIPEDHSDDLPPPPQFQSSDDLPPPPPPLQLQCNIGQSNPAFQEPTEDRIENSDGKDNRYCYLENNSGAAHRRYGSVPVEGHRAIYSQRSRYEYIQDEQRDQIQRRGSLRYEFIPHQQVQQRSAPVTNQDDGRELQMQSCRNNGGRYAVVPGDQDYQDEEIEWNSAKHVSSVRSHINTPQGKFGEINRRTKPRNPIAIFSRPWQ